MSDEQLLVLLLLLANPPILEYDGCSLFLLAQLTPACKHAEEHACYCLFLYISILSYGISGDTRLSLP